MNTLEPIGHSMTTPLLSLFTQQQPSATSVTMLSQKKKFGVFKNITIIISFTF
jgi:hypothetical protein